jgi:hypothetical protein
LVLSLTPQRSCYSRAHTGKCGVSRALFPNFAGNSGSASRHARRVASSLGFLDEQFVRSCLFLCVFVCECVCVLCVCVVVL